MMKKQYTRSLKSLVAMGKTYTTNKDLALELGRELDRTPIEFINPETLRDDFSPGIPP
jgi:hypothetical protein